MHTYSIVARDPETGERYVRRPAFEGVELPNTHGMALFADGGLLYCTSHFVQDHCSIEELTFAFDTAYELCRSVT